MSKIVTLQRPLRRRLVLPQDGGGVEKVVVEISPAGVLRFRKHRGRKWMQLSIRAAIDEAWQVRNGQMKLFAAEKG